jgi:ribonuclease HIII
MLIGTISSHTPQIGPSKYDPLKRCFWGIQLLMWVFHCQAIQKVSDLYPLVVTKNI